MKSEIRGLIIDTCGWIVTVSIVVFFFTLWLFSYNDIQEPLKESWSITFNSLASFTTIGAAILATKLFNDWKDQEEYKIKNENIYKVIIDSESLINEINNMKLPLARFSGKMEKKEDLFVFLLENYSNLNDRISNLLNNINHLADIKNKGFSSEMLFLDFSHEKDLMMSKLEGIILGINELNNNSDELFELKIAIENMKEHINSSLIRTLKKSLRKF